MTNTIIPAILEDSLGKIQTKMNKVYHLVDLVQVDICDGFFVPSRTYASTGRLSSLNKILSLTRNNNMALELDLMVDLDRSRVMTHWSTVLPALDVDRIVFHLGSTYRWDELFNRLQHNSKRGRISFECGLAIRIDTPRAEVRKILESRSEFSYIQIMGINRVGYSGQKISPDLCAYIKKIRRSFPDYPIQIDGGVKTKHVAGLFECGADRLGMNSGLFKTHNIKQTLKELSL